MLDYLSQLSDFNVFVLLNIVFIAISIGAIILVKKHIPLHIRSKHNTVIGYTSSLISLIYGVLVGLTALYLFNINSYTADAVQREVNTVADMYRDSQWLQPKTRLIIQTTLKQYMIEVIGTEWPLMTHGKQIGRYGDYLINKIMGDLMQYQSKNPVESRVVYSMLDGVKTLYDARHQRIYMSYSDLGPEIWIVILVGSFLTLLINYFYGMHFYFHALVVVSVALMASSMIFLLLMLNRPFQGEFNIKPTAMDELLIHLNNNTGNTTTLD